MKTIKKEVTASLATKQNKGYMTTNEPLDAYEKWEPKEVKATKNAVSKT